MSTYSYSNEIMEEELNKIREIIVHSLYNEGSITKEVYEEYITNRAIIIKHPSFFNKIWKKLYNDTASYYILIKQLNFGVYKDPDDKDPNDNKSKKKSNLKILKLKKDD